MQFIAISVAMIISIVSIVGHFVYLLTVAIVVVEIFVQHSMCDHFENVIKNQKQLRALRRPFVSVQLMHLFPKHNQFLFSWFYFSLFFSNFNFVDHSKQFYFIPLMTELFTVCCAEKLP